MYGVPPAEAEVTVVDGALASRRFVAVTAATAPSPVSSAGTCPNRPACAGRRSSTAPSGLAAERSGDCSSSDADRSAINACRRHARHSAHGGTMAEHVDGA